MGKQASKLIPGEETSERIGERTGLFNGVDWVMGQ